MFSSTWLSTLEREGGHGVAIFLKLELQLSSQLAPDHLSATLEREVVHGARD